MGDVNPLEIGVGIAAALLILERVFAFIIGIIDKLTGKVDTDPGAELAEILRRMDERMRSVEDKVCDLHDWHSVVDAKTGVRVWYSAYGTADLKETLVSLGETLKTVAEVLRNVVQQQQIEAGKLDAMAKEVGAVKNKVDGLR